MNCARRPGVSSQSGGGGLRAEEDGRRHSGSGSGSERCEIGREKDEREMDNTHKGEG